MVDAPRLARILSRVRQDLATLRRYVGADRPTLVADEVAMGHVKYCFVTLMEGCIDAAQHICASEGYGPPDTNADAMHVLAHNGVLPGAVAQAMAAGVRLRNVLVHLYSDVDDARVADHLDGLDDVERYVEALVVLLVPGAGA